MLFSKSIAFDEEDLVNVAAAAKVIPARPSIDIEYLDRLKNGDAEAFDLLITNYSADVYSLLMRLTGDADEAGDLTQDTFLNALRSVKNFRGDSELKTWLFRIAINESRNRFRWWKRRKRGSTLSLDAPVGASETALHETLSGDSEDPEQATLRRERERALTTALRSMPAIFREAIVLCDIEGLSYQEIAESLGIGLGTVKSRIGRGREELRKRLKGF